MDILDNMGVSKLSANVNYSFKTLSLMQQLQLHFSQMHVCI